ncbi:DNA replication terminus site-binding protein [Neptunomonas antarctica]|uniref:DNA replication terminus site binding protein n=1 Tax=Neptunomonas antarctica TaxID=619304 RepID=A0A1N7LQY3_9GAMM|nr:DNA replication terminus site-binding protein [Neptunomonas antarctica]SIS76263.1 DNA replication terminus site binding protein [Neptunomonas antarctica]
MVISHALLDDVIEAFELLKLSLCFFDQELSRSERPVSLPTESDTTIITHNDAINQVRQRYTDIWHSDQQDGRRTHSSYGLVGADENLLNAAFQLNICKDRLRHTVSALKKSELSDVSQQLYQRSHALALALNHQGLGRLHLKQCYRHIPQLDSRPDTIRFSWYSSGRSICKLTAKNAMEMLLKLDTSQEHIVRQIEKLSPLNKTTIMAQIQKQAPVIRANMAWKTGVKSWRRMARNCPLPILVPLTEDEFLPEYNHLTLTPPPERSRALRSDSLIDPEPFLPSLRIHLYRN